MPDLEAAFRELREILAPYGQKLAVVHDDTSQFYVDTAHVQKNGKPLFFGAVQVKKNYVSFHLMPVYVRPDLLAAASPDLKARMQGKSCFNFKSPEPVLFRELAKLTKAGYESYRQQGFVP